MMCQGLDICLAGGSGLLDKVSGLSGQFKILIGVSRFGSFEGLVRWRTWQLRDMAEKGAWIQRDELGFMQKREGVEARDQISLNGRMAGEG
jgi:hypothetical protein